MSIGATPPVFATLQEGAPDETLFRVGRALRLSVAGAVLAQGAPLGWLALRWVIAGSAPGTEIAGDPALYVYLTVATTAAFAAFGWKIGMYEERLAEANRRLDRLSRSDELTGLENRRSLTESLPRLISFARRSRSPLSVVAITLDRPRDEALRDVARALLAHRRREDIVARTGADEVVLVLPGTAHAGAKAVAARALAEVRALGVEAAAGTAELEPSDHRSLALLARAIAAVDRRTSS